MEKYKVEVQDENGNIYYPHTEADVTFMKDGENVEDKINEILSPGFDDSGTADGITDKTSLLSSLISKMPLVKFMRNVKAGFKLALYAGEIVNNCVTNRPDLPLSAAQGKVLMDMLTVLNTNLTGLNARFHFDRVAIMQPFFDDAEKSFGYRLYYDVSMTAGYAIHFYFNGEKRITLRFLDTDGRWKNTWTGLLQ